MSCQTARGSPIVKAPAGSRSSRIVEGALPSFCRPRRMHPRCPGRHLPMLNKHSPMANPQLLLPHRVVPSALLRSALKPSNICSSGASFQWRSWCLRVLSASIRQRGNLVARVDCVWSGAAGCVGEQGSHGDADHDDDKQWRQQQRQSRGRLAPALLLSHPQQQPRVCRLRHRRRHPQARPLPAP